MTEGEEWFPNAPLEVKLRDGFSLKNPPPLTECNALELWTLWLTTPAPSARTTALLAELRRRVGRSRVLDELEARYSPNPDADAVGLAIRALLKGLRAPSDKTGDRAPPDSEDRFAHNHDTDALRRRALAVAGICFLNPGELACEACGCDWTEANPEIVVERLRTRLARSPLPAHTVTGPSDAELDRWEERARRADPDDATAEDRAQNLTKQGFCNAALYATARTQVLALIAEVRRLRSTVTDEWLDDLERRYTVPPDERPGITRQKHRNEASEALGTVYRHRLGKDGGFPEVGVVEVLNAEKALAGALAEADEARAAAADVVLLVGEVRKLRSAR